jgi:hypothetical protein
MTSRYSRVFSTVLLLLCAAAFSQLQAQQGGTISGTVVDQTGKGISNASVELRGESSAAPRTATTDSAGKFSVPDVAPGTYNDCGFGGRFL